MKFEYMIKFSEKSGNRCATTDCWIGKNWLSLYIFTLSKIKALTFVRFQRSEMRFYRLRQGTMSRGFPVEREASAKLRELRSRA